MTEEKEKKGGFFKKVFGLKSKEDKLAEEAAERAAQQKLVDEQMAARMAAINAAALKSAREQDERAAGIDVDAERDTEEQSRLEAEEKRRAEEQARRDVEAAKKLEAEKRLEAERLEAERKAAEIKAQEEAATEARRIAEEQEALERARREKGEREAAALKVKQEAEAKARAALAAKEEAERQRLAEIKAAEEKKAAEKYAIEKAAREKAALEIIAREKEIADAKAAQAALEAKKKRAAEQQVDPTDGFLERISTGLRKSTSRMSDNMSAVFTKRKLDDDAIEELEDLLVASDFGIGPATKVTTLLAKDRFDKQVTDMEIKVALADVISDILTPLEKPLVLTDQKPQIILFVGVNGSGKTTTLGKIAKRYTDSGKKVLIVAGDTFRAAAVEQLSVWGERSGAPVMSGALGADAAGLVYDAIERARREAFDIVMIDTAGRLQNRTELMDELSKIVRVIKKQDETAPHHCVLVLDATVGQNALSQTEAFKETAGVTGLIMTKLDGTAKGGVLVALSDKYQLPIHAIGIGERMEDLENFSAPVFAAALSGVADVLNAP